MMVRTRRQPAGRREAREVGGGPQELNEYDRAQELNEYDCGKPMAGRTREAGGGRRAPRAERIRPREAGGGPHGRKDAGGGRREEEEEGPKS